MRSRLGEKASQIIKNDNFLPFFRNRQIKYREEFEKSVEIAETKQNPEHYLASIWKSSNIEKSLRWLRGLTNTAIAKINEIKQQIAQRAEGKRLKEVYNPAGRQRLIDIYKQHNLLN